MTQVINPEFVFYGPMGFGIGAFLGNSILAFFSPYGPDVQTMDQRAYKECILEAIANYGVSIKGVLMRHIF